MTHAELLRSHADLAIKEGGMYYSGEYLSGMAYAAESLEAENARLRELVRDALTTISWCTIDCCPSDNKKSELSERARELGVEVGA